MHLQNSSIFFYSLLVPESEAMFEDEVDNGFAAKDFYGISVAASSDKSLSSGRC